MTDQKDDYQQGLGASLSGIGLELYNTVAEALLIASGSLSCTLRHDGPRISLDLCLHQLPQCRCLRGLLVAATPCWS